MVVVFSSLSEYTRDFITTQINLDIVYAVARFIHVNATG